MNGVVDGMKYLEGTPRGDGHRWRPGVEEKLGFYVYVLVDPRVQDGEIFYCGKGTGTRCFAHIAEARKTLNDATKDYPKLDRIRAIEDAGNDVRIDVLRHGLTEHEAFLVESAVIDVIPNLTNAVLGHNSNRLRATDINALHGATPLQFDPDHKVILIRVARAYYPGIPDDELFSITSGFWKIAAVSRAIGGPKAPDHAMAVHRGVVRAVYRIDGWRGPTDIEAAEDPTRIPRWAFRGERDQVMERRYAFADVTALLPQAAQNPIAYVNCGRQPSAAPTSPQVDGLSGKPTARQGKSPRAVPHRNDIIAELRTHAYTGSVSTSVPALRTLHAAYMAGLAAPELPDGQP